MERNILHNEQELLRQMAEGRESAFKAIYRFYYVELQPLLRKYAGTGIEAEEVLQETFIRVWLSREKLPELENFRAWLFTVASRVYLTALRTKLNYDKRVDGYSSVIQSDHPMQITPLEFTQLEAIKKCVAEAIHQLPPRRREVYELSRAGGMSIDEIAKRLDLSKQTVKNVLQQATKAIRDHLTVSGYGSFCLLFIFFETFL